MNNNCFLKGLGAWAIAMFIVLEGFGKFFTGLFIVGLVLLIYYLIDKLGRLISKTIDKIFLNISTNELEKGVDKLILKWLS